MSKSVASLGAIVRMLFQAATWIAVAGCVALVVATVAVFGLGLRPNVVTSGSMTPTIPVGSVALSKRADASTVHVGEVITATRADGHMVTHRVISAEPKNGLTEIQLKGDANHALDPLPLDVTSVYRPVRIIDGGGRLLMKLHSPLATAIIGGLFGISFLLLLLQIKQTFAEPEWRHRRGYAPKAKTKPEADIDLRQPLTSLVGYVELLQDGSLGELKPQQANAVEVLRRNTERLIEDLKAAQAIE
jgi:signal peptidase I